MNNDIFAFIAEAARALPDATFHPVSNPHRDGKVHVMIENKSKLGRFTVRSVHGDCSTVSDVIEWAKL